MHVCVNFCVNFRLKAQKRHENNRYYPSKAVKSPLKRKNDILCTKLYIFCRSKSRFRAPKNSREFTKEWTFGNVWELLWTFEWIFWELLGTFGNFWELWVNFQLRIQKRRESNRYYCYLAVASPWTNNNDSSRPGRYIMPRMHQGTIIPVMNINRYYPCHFIEIATFRKRG